MFFFFFFFKEQSSHTYMHVYIPDARYNFQPEKTAWATVEHLGPELFVCRNMYVC